MHEGNWLLLALGTRNIIWGGADVAQQLFYLGNGSRMDVAGFKVQYCEGYNRY